MIIQPIDNYSLLIPEINTIRKLIDNLKKKTITMIALQGYGSSDDNSGDENENVVTINDNVDNIPQNIKTPTVSSLNIKICSAPEVEASVNLFSYNEFIIMNLIIKQILFLYNFSYMIYASDQLIQLQKN